MDMILSELVSTLTRSEKMELLGTLKAAIAEELAPSLGDPDACPRCSCPHFVKKGKGRHGEQRWLCKGCGQTFSASTMGLLSRSKLEPVAWMEFASCMADELTLRESASRCGVSLYTAWFMRMRVCEVMARRLPLARRGTFWVDETYVRENLSGNHAQSRWFEMPRDAHRNGQDGKRGRIGRAKTSFSIVCGVNEFGDCFCDVGDRGTSGAGSFGLTILGRVPKGSRIVTDDNPAYSFWEGDPFEHEAHAAKREGMGSLAPVNALHSRLKAFLSKMRGVSIRRLQRYLDWFCYKEHCKNLDADRRDVLFSHEANGRYVHTRSLTHLEEHPEYQWWTRQMSTVV